MLHVVAEDLATVASIATAIFFLPLDTSFAWASTVKDDGICCCSIADRRRGAGTKAYAVNPFDSHLLLAVPMHSRKKCTDNKSCRTEKFIFIHDLITTNNARIYSIIYYADNRILLISLLLLERPGMNNETLSCLNRQQETIIQRENKK